MLLHPFYSMVTRTARNILNMANQIRKQLEHDVPTLKLNMPASEGKQQYTFFTILSTCVPITNLHLKVPLYINASKALPIAVYVHPVSDEAN